LLLFYEGVLSLLIPLEPPYDLVLNKL